MIDAPITAFGPDFTFAFDDWITHPDGLGQIPADQHGQEVAVIGAGMAGVVTAYELMKLGLKPVIYESGKFGGRLRSETFEGTEDVIAELGGMRFPISSTGFYHYVDKLGVQSRPFPNPLSAAAGSTVIDLEGKPLYAESLDDLPALFREVADAYDQALEDGARFSDLQAAIGRRDANAVKEIWNPIVKGWDERSFYDFVAQSDAFRKLSFRHREVFGQVGFGTGGWDSDFPNSMLEILRVNALRLDDDQRYMVGGVESVPRGLWSHAPERIVHWPQGTTLEKLHSGAPLPGVVRIHRDGEGDFEVSDRWGRTKRYGAVVATCQSWLLTTAMDVDERLLSQDMWMALDRTRYMQSSKTFVMVDRPFWRDRDPQTNRETMSVTLTDRMTRGTYLFENGPDKPAVICLTYSWMSDALKMAPLPVEQRVDLALAALSKIYPGVDIGRHIIGNPITVSWENDPNFLGAFKGALPGHYRYNHRMYGHFMQDDMPAEQRGLFLAGDGISWTPAWVEGAVQTALNAVWGVMHHFGGQSHPSNPGPGEAYPQMGPIDLGD
ncbi:FAD-dependent oxidoreductase [Pseudohalocynthiibacter aestuariivivens]|nr:NAD(P)/FAD-dependent oxidoreductase [Pseudohalocynthiibacter aestuariivivens]QIE46492.1 FAD-dependent oxidoreductase [Pseudohalocynthiibacter aestuariivivens]